jgi:hypothetical protein
MSTLKYNPYNLTDAEIFGSASQAIALQATISTWVARADLPNLDTLKATPNNTSTRRGGFGGFGGFSGGPNFAEMAIAAARQKSGQLPKIILADVALPIQAMTSIEASLKKKYSEPQIIGVIPGGGGGLFNRGRSGQPIYGPPGGFAAERKAIISNTQSEGNVIFKFNGETYLYWANQFRLMQMATDSIISSLAAVNINLVV